MILPVAIVDAFYSIVALPAMWIYLRIGAMVSARLRARTELERQARESLQAVRWQGPRLWAHAASMGELEQLIPILERIKHARPEIVVIVTCTSPSGIRHALRTRHCIDAAAFLDLDTTHAARRWLDAIRPAALLIDRYDLWRHHTCEVHRRRIPIHLVNATMPSAGRGALRKWVADTYRRCASITAATPSDAAELSALTGQTVTVAPDTRFDRVLDRIASPDAHVLTYRRPDTVTLVLGSSWRKDEDLILDAMSAVDFKGRCIIVPHEPTEEALRSIERRLPCTRWSASKPSTTGHLVVDSVGSLLSIYAIADAAWVGGGFIAGVHSVVEPAAYGLPLACGPNIDRARDARPLLDAGCLHVCTTPQEAQRWLRDVVMRSDVRSAIGHVGRDYVAARAGSAVRLAAIVLDSIDQ